MRLLINRRPVLAALILLAVLDCPSTLRAAEQRVADPKELPRFPPVASRDALNTFQLRKGFHLELVAAEPLVTDPIAFAFDEDGRLFVVEMNDYPDRKQHRGRIRRLVDTDGDGRFDKATVFAKDLRWPSAIHCYGGGVFVGSAPDLLYFKDTNDDGVADEKKVVLTGWGNRAGTLDPEGVFGSLAWGLDNRIHGLVNRHSGDITNPSDPTAKPVRLGGNFAFDPRTMALTVEAGEGQYGMGFNDDASVQTLAHAGGARERVDQPGSGRPYGFHLRRHSLSKPREDHTAQFCETRGSIRQRNGCFHFGGRCRNSLHRSKEERHPNRKHVIRLRRTHLPGSGRFRRRGGKSRHDGDGEVFGSHGRRESRQRIWLDALQSHVL